MRTLRVMLLSVLAVAVSGCGYNRIQQQDEAVKAAWSEVLNQYQRRADLVPNLVNTVKGYAAQEQKVLLGVTEARAKVGTIQATPELVNDPQAFQKFEAAQGQLTQALKSLMAVTENYPQLKSDQNFRDLQSQLEGTENRITVARNRYIQAVQEYNVTIRSFPTNLTAMRVQVSGEAELHGAERGRRSRSRRPWISAAARASAPAPAPARSSCSERVARGRIAAVAAPSRSSGSLRSRCSRPCSPSALAGGCAGAAADSEARSARHRSDRHADRRAAGRARAEAGRLRGAQGRADRGADGADHRSRRRSSSIRSASSRPGSSGARGSTTARC